MSYKIQSENHLFKKNSELKKTCTNVFMSLRSILKHENYEDLKLKDYLLEKRKKEIEKNLESSFFPFYLEDGYFPCKSAFTDYSLECTESFDSNVHSGHRMFDLHGYTTNGTEQALRRVLTSVDRSRQQVIKINVGQGSHSQNGVAKLPDVVKKVAKDLQLPVPIRHEKNPGYLLMILPPLLSTD